MMFVGILVTKMPIVKHEKEALKWLWDHRKNRKEYFDYPDYGGLPFRLSNKLTSEFVDYIQDLWYTKHKSYKAFEKEILSYYVSPWG